MASEGYCTCHSKETANVHGCCRGGIQQHWKVNAWREWTLTSPVPSLQELPVVCTYLIQSGCLEWLQSLKQRVKKWWAIEPSTILNFLPMCLLQLRSLHTLGCFAFNLNVLCLDPVHCRIQFWNSILLAADVEQSKFTISLTMFLRPFHRWFYFTLF